MVNAVSPPGLTARTRPTSVMIPVNIAGVT
jgi:hypothetical protein